MALGAGLATALLLIVVPASAGWLLMMAGRIPYATLGGAVRLCGFRCVVSCPAACGSTIAMSACADAPAIVLVHGFAASIQAWDGRVRALSKDYRVVVLDLPGHGLDTHQRTPSAIRPDSFGRRRSTADPRPRTAALHLGGNSMGARWPGPMPWTIRTRSSAWCWSTPPVGRHPAGAGDDLQVHSQPIGRRVLKESEISAADGPGPAVGLSGAKACRRRP
ncbi:alpha/beta fold hydrolase [Caulobacter segnis]